MTKDGADESIDHGYTLFYDGCNPCLKDPFCACCQAGHQHIVILSGGGAVYAHRHPQKKVRKCSSCKVVYYCSVACQQKDRNSHKKLCTMIKKSRKHVTKMEGQLVSGRNGDPSDAAVGHYWQRALPYVKARYDLCLLLHSVAFSSNIKDTWTAINADMQDLLRLSHLNRGEDLGLRGKFPFFLISEGGRLDDVYSFCRYMLQRNASGEIDDALQAGSAKGDWIYPREKNCRFHNILDECSEWKADRLDDSTGIYFVTAVWLVKKMILSMFYTTLTAIACFESTALGGMLSEMDGPHENIYHFLLGFPELNCPGHGQLMLEQERQFDALSDMIYEHNSHIFENMTDFLNGATYHNIAPGRPNINPLGPGHSWEQEVAFGIVNDCKYSLSTIPGLIDWLASFQRKQKMAGNKKKR